MRSLMMPHPPSPQHHRGVHPTDRRPLEVLEGKVPKQIGLVLIRWDEIGVKRDRTVVTRIVITLAALAANRHCTLLKP
jgi:hypothetical protein